MREKKDLILDVLSGIDEALLQKNLEKRYALWQKPKKRRRPLVLSLISAAACIVLLITGLFAFMRTPDDVPVYHGMTVSKENVGALPAPSASTASADALCTTLLHAPQKTVFPNRVMLYGGPESQKPEKELPVFGQSYYAMPGEDIYINIHLSNPGGYEILSFTLNGVKYSSYMFEPGSDLETLILKTNVGETGGLKEYTIDAIKYVDGERIKNVKMKGDKTVKVHVNDEGNDNSSLRLTTEMDGLTLNIHPTFADSFQGEKKLLSLALYKDNVLYKELAPDASFVNGLPLGTRFVLKAVYLEQGQEQTVHHVFDTPKESEGLVILDGMITAIGTCTDTVLYLDHPIADQFLYEQPKLKVQKIYMTENVTSIGESAFHGCETLETAVLPKSLTEIPDFLFARCINLKSISLPEKPERIGNYAFSYCSKLDRLTLPKGLVSIGSFAFEGCASLTDIVIPSSVTRIENGTFNSCTSLTSVEIPGSVTSIGEAAFEYCSSLTSIVIPDSITRIENDTFSYCTSLTRVEIPGNVTSIGKTAFFICKALTEVTIPDSVTSIEWAAFCGTALTSIVIPDSVTSMGTAVFDGCNALTVIYCDAPRQPASWRYNWKGACSAQVIFTGALNCNHLFAEATCQKPKTCTVCGLYEGPKTPHILNEESVCTLCGYSVADMRQNAIKDAPQEGIEFSFPTVEIWEKNLHLLIDAPYLGTPHGNGTSPEDLWFDLYCTPTGSSDYTLATLYPWSLYSFEDHSVYRLHFYDLLYPGLTVGTKYNVTIVMGRGDSVIGFTECSLEWTKEFEDLVQQAISDPGITK